jgi:hypothetical protein
MEDKFDDILQLESFYKKYGTTCWTDNESFDRHGFLVVQNIVDPNVFYDSVPDKRGQYNYHLHREEPDYHELETQVPVSTSRYNYPKYRYHYNQVRKKLEQAIGKDLINTYYFDRFYYYGSELVKHRDRHSCEISVTIHLDTNIKKNWPVKVQSYSGQVYSINLEPGDAVIYKGCELFHWRDPMPSKYNKIERGIRKLLKKDDDSYYHQIFCHFVLADGLRNFFGYDATLNMADYE